LLDGIDKLFSEKLTVPVIISEDPLDNVAKGAGVLLEHMDTKTAKENN
jgi:rod shape-determining protein MreB